MPLVVPLAAEISQELRVTLNSQLCRIRVYAKSVEVPVHQPETVAINPPVYQVTGLMFLDLYVRDVLIIGGVICYHNNRLVRDSYLGFTGDLTFLDLFGEDDPDYTGLGTRWVLLYWAPDELTEASKSVGSLVYLLNNDAVTPLLNNDGTPLVENIIY